MSSGHLVVLLNKQQKSGISFILSHICELIVKFVKREGSGSDLTKMGRNSNFDFERAHLIVWV